MISELKSRFGIFLTCTNPNGNEELVVPSDAVLNFVLQSKIISWNWQVYLYACAAFDSPFKNKIKTLWNNLKLLSNSVIFIFLFSLFAVLIKSAFNYLIMIKWNSSVSRNVLSKTQSSLLLPIVNNYANKGRAMPACICFNIQVDLSAYSFENE